MKIVSAQDYLGRSQTLQARFVRRIIYLLIFLCILVAILVFAPDVLADELNVSATYGIMLRGINNIDMHVESGEIGTHNSTFFKIP